MKTVKNWHCGEMQQIHDHNALIISILCFLFVEPEAQEPISVII